MEWATFLEARMEFIKSQLKEGKSNLEIYRILQVDPNQVHLLCMEAQRQIQEEKK